MIRGSENGNGKLNRLTELSKGERYDVLLISDSSWFANIILKMYWRFRLNSKHGYALKDESEEPIIPVEQIQGPLEDYFCIKTDVKHEKRPTASLEADKVILDLCRNSWRT